ncbi:MAG: EAL domain-containing protein [Hyphomicrobiaceae bacterium]
MKRLHRRLLTCVLGILTALACLSAPAHAVKPIALTGNEERLEITGLGETFEGRGDTLQVETAAGPDSAVGRMAVRATTPGTNPNWLVFALHNTTQKTIELWLSADRYNVVGSGVVWPDLDARRVEAVTHSAGYAPERIKNDRSDVFRLTLERGQTVTFVAELSSERFSRVFLTKPIYFEQRLRERQLFNGIMLGLTGLLAVFLTAVFAANHKVIFPAAALVAWCALAMLCVDFGFWHKLFQMRPEDNAQYRAVSEAALAASLVIFLAAFLRVNLWGAFARMLFIVWIVAQLGIVATAVLDPRLAATVARISFPIIGGVGLLLMLALAVRGIDRALALLPTWILYLVWLFGAGVTLTGRLGGEFAISGLLAGLVLIVLLLGFTVTQFAFRSSEPLFASAGGQQQLRLAALDRAGAFVWEWNARRDEFKVDPEVEASLGLQIGELPNKTDDFVEHLHPTDKSLFRESLDAIKERATGAVNLELRMRHADSSYRWFELEGAALPLTDRKQLRCVGLIRDVTDAKRAQERLLHNAVHDSLTELPNRELFLDRLDMAMLRANTGPSSAPAVFLFDIDKFKSVNSSFGLVVGDSILLTVARRLARNVKPSDTLARIGGDQFALFITGHQGARELAVLAERLRLAVRSPIRMAGQEIVLTGAIGIALFDGKQANARDLLREAETAMLRAKRAGSDRLQIFEPAMRVDKDQRIAIESDLRRAIEARQLKLLYQPIVSLSSEDLIGFEALVRWRHPRLGDLSPADFIPVAEESDLIVQLGSYVLAQAASDIARWQRELPRPEQPLFVSVNVSSRQLIKPDLVNEIRHTLGRSVIPGSSLRLEITESLIMQNPEQAAQILDLLREVGVHIAIDDFGTGYSSLAYLNRFQFDTIKIDKALVQASGDGDRGSIIIRSIVALAHELDKRLVAEGVETPEDAAFLRSIGCHAAQGFHYGEPMPDSDVSRLLKLIRKADRKMRRRGIVRGAEKKKAAEAEQAPTTPPTAANGHAPTPADRTTPLTGQRQAPPQPQPMPRTPPVQNAHPQTRPLPPQGPITPSGPIGQKGHVQPRGNGPHQANGPRPHPQQPPAHRQAPPDATRPLQTTYPRPPQQPPAAPPMGTLPAGLPHSLTPAQSPASATPPLPQGIDAAVPPVRTYPPVQEDAAAPEASARDAAPLPPIYEPPPLRERTQHDEPPPRLPHETTPPARPRLPHESGQATPAGSESTARNAVRTRIERAVGRAPSDSLPPDIAERLARLAGNRTEDRSHQDRDTPPPTTKKPAAE